MADTRGVQRDGHDMGLELSGWCEGTTLRIVVAGELDISSGDDLTTAIEALIEPGMDLVLDLDGLTFVDSAGVRVLMRIADAAARSYFSVRFVALDGAAIRRTAAALDATSLLPLVAR